MPRHKNHLEDYEVSLIKALLSNGEYRAYQDILAYFTRPTRSVNHARISEIADAMGGEPMHKNAQKYVSQPIASNVSLKAFLNAWPNIDPETGLHIQDDELIIKSREAMLFAVQAYNNPTTYFKSEMFIVSAVIGWLYLLHYYYKENNVDIIHRNDEGVPIKIDGRDKLLELSSCIKLEECPLDEGTVNNIEFLIGIRNEIEHEKTSNIDDAISAKLQQCCLNYNRLIKEIVGEGYGLDRKLSLALQFLYIDPREQTVFSGADMLPSGVSSFITKFEDDMTNPQYNDPHYACRMVMFRKNENNKENADLLCEIVAPNSDIEDRINTVFKDRERPKFLPMEIIKLVQGSGYNNFNIREHTKLRDSLDAKNPANGYGVDISGKWYWYQSWLDKVLAHAANEENSDTG